MDVSIFGLGSVAAITAIAYLAGMAIKASTLNDEWIPILCGVVGGIFGYFGMTVIPDFPAHDWITAIAVGIVSGLAATGINQAVRQLTKKQEIGDSSV